MMSLIEKIKEGEDLQAYLKEECEDEGICVEFDPGIDKNTVLVIKVVDSQCWQGNGLENQNF